MKNLISIIVIFVCFISLNSFADTFLFDETKHRICKDRKNNYKYLLVHNFKYHPENDFYDHVVTLTVNDKKIQNYALDCNFDYWWFDFTYDCKTSENYTTFHDEINSRLVYLHKDGKFLSTLVCN